MTDRIEDGRPAADELVMVPKAFLDFVKDAPVSSGVCCCGDNMADHADPMSCGHAPTDQWEYSLRRWLDEIAAPARQMGVQTRRAAHG